MGFALGSGTAFLQHGSLLSLAMAAVNLFIAALFVRRRPEDPPPAALDFGVSRSATILAWIGTFLPFLLRPASTLPPLALGLELVGMLGIIFSLSALGRCFGISPARRGVVTHGLYAWVRHPLYAAELIYFLGVVIAAPTLANGILWIVLFGVQLRRAFNEERCLQVEAAYRDYLGAVRYRFVPGLL